MKSTLASAGFALAVAVCSFGSEKQLRPCSLRSESYMSRRAATKFSNLLGGRGTLRIPLVGHDDKSKYDLFVINHAIEVTFATHVLEKGH